MFRFLNHLNFQQVRDPDVQTPKSPENNNSKSSKEKDNKTMKLSSASQRTLNRKRSQQHLDSQLRNDGEETEEDLLLNNEKNIREKRNFRNNDDKHNMSVKNKSESTNFIQNGVNPTDICNETIPNSTKSKKQKKNNKLQTSSTVGAEEIMPNQEASMCHDHTQGMEKVLQNNMNNCENQCQEHLFSDPLQDVHDMGMIDLDKPSLEEYHHQELQKRNNIFSSHHTNHIGENSTSEVIRKEDQREVENCMSSNSFNLQQPDIVSWFPLLSKTSAMQCKTDDNDIKPFRSNVETPFVSASLKNNAHRNTFNCDDIASPKLAARHAMMLEKSAAKHAAIANRLRTPSLCFNVSASENSDTECHNKTPLL
jgi:hypothetical protein